MKQPVFVQASFDDVDHFNEAVSGWSTDFRQVARGRFDSQLTQIASDELHIAVSGFSTPIAQSGSAPRGMRTFAIRNDGLQGMAWCGRIVHPDAVLCFDKSKQFECLSPGGFSVSTISLSEDLIAATATSLGFADFVDDAPCGTDVRALDEELLRRVENSINKSGSIAAANDQRAWQQHQDELAGQLTMLLIDASVPCGRRVSNRARILRRAMSYIIDNAHNAVSVAETCAAIGVSWRTLDRTFREHLGASPKDCILGVRLHRVRGELKQAGPGSRISDIANTWGFWHMGDFAREYRREFRELPSETLASP